MINLIAVHAIIRKVKGKTVREAPGEHFECSEDEAEFYLNTKAATAAPATTKAKAEKAEKAEKVTGEADPGKKKAAAKPTPEQAAKADTTTDEGQGDGQGEGVMG